MQVSILYLCEEIVAKKNDEKHDGLMNVNLIPKSRLKPSTSDSFFKKKFFFFVFL